MELLLDSAWIDGATRTGVRLLVAGERVASVEPVAVPGNGWHGLPGFANAHSHLDLSALKGEELPHGTFAEWVVALVEGRARIDAATVRTSIQTAISELLDQGTVAVGDIDSLGLADAVVRASPLEGVSYREVLGSQAGTALDAVAAGFESDSAAREGGAGGPASRLRRGISPHAPYSTGESIYQRAFALAARLGVPVASHLAESAEEEELLLRGTGPLAELFRRWNFALPPWSDPRAGSAARVLALRPPAGRFVVIHGNRLSEEEITACARQRWPVVYCPRSHRYFGHPPHPAARVVAAGGVLALGTDSRASNDGLDLWREMECFRAADPGIADDAILRAATAGGRTALGLERAELKPGDAATFQLVRSRDGSNPDDLSAAATRGGLTTGAVVIRGEVVRSKEQPLPER